MGILDALGIHGSSWGSGKNMMHGVWDDFTGAAQANKTNQKNVLLSNTAVQRRVADLKTAGFNPLLAVGQAADVPQQNVPPGQREGISSAIEAYRTYGASKVLDAQVNATNASAKASEAEAAYKTAITPGSAAQIASQTDVNKQSVVESQSRVSLNEIQSKVLNATGQKISAETALVFQQVGLTQANTAQVAKTIDVLNEQIKNIQQDTSLKTTQQAESAIRTAIGSIDASTASQLQPYLIQMQQNAAAKGKTEADAASNIMGIAAANMKNFWSIVLPGINSAQSVSQMIPSAARAPMGFAP